MDQNKIIEYTQNTQCKKEPDIIHISNPKHVGTGIICCLKNVSIGLLGGVLSVIALPINGAKQEGIKGFVKGVGYGLIGGIILPVVGVFVGGGQIIAGMYNTPHAINSKINGKIWDNDNEIWYYYSLKDETTRLANISEEQFLNSLESKTYWNNDSYKIKNVIDTELYDILELDINAKHQDIKNAYYNLAKKYHPDKNDNKSSTRFNKINEAYQILGNIETREKYDKVGKDVLNTTDIIDSTHLYTFLFGTKVLQSYTGDLSLSMIMSLKQTSPLEVLKFKQIKREIYIANNILTLLNSYMNTDENMESYYIGKCNTITINPFNIMIVGLIGRIYVECGQNFLGIVSTIINTLSETKRSIQYKYKLAALLIDASANKDNDNGIDTGIDIILNLVTSDIENTIQNSCFKILNDSDVSIDIRTKRANGLIYIGQIFYRYISDDISKQFLIRKFTN